MTTILHTEPQRDGTTRRVTGRLETGRLRRATVDLENLPVPNFPVELLYVFAALHEPFFLLVIFLPRIFLPLIHSTK